MKTLYQRRFRIYLYRDEIEVNMYKNTSIVERETEKSYMLDTGRIHKEDVDRLIIKLYDNIGLIYVEINSFEKDDNIIKERVIKKFEPLVNKIKEAN